MPGRFLSTFHHDETALNNHSTSYVIGRNSFALLKATHFKFTSEAKEKTLVISLEEKSRWREE
eukprot:scaffold8725_cov96-Skeletonema_marinoi.AAC.5